MSSVTSQNKESILEKILSDLPTIGDEGYVFIKSKTGQVFACKMPKVQQPEKSEATSYNPKYLAELVSASFYVKNSSRITAGGTTNCAEQVCADSIKAVWAVRYECDPQLSTSEAYIHHVEEAASCEYIITVKVGSLCSLSAFMPPNLVRYCTLPFKFQFMMNS
ncbi:unnamed protein product [Heligmosomoides polygyrus]|uniref:PRKCSH domain-containing protein n=1 Tax=Heligmosomoides polygyrus TaxID=6339 RepID=A0A3P7ZTZ1_HELPZ|nr:unnamed protein product [Heligmosomoides polygyrus]